MDHGPFAFTRVDGMSCTLTVDGPCRRTLSFSIDRATVDAQVQAELRELAGRASFKGFRPGKVPLDLEARAARDRKSTRLNSSHFVPSRMPSSA